MDTSNKKTLTVRIVAFALILLAIVLLMRVVVRSTNRAGKYDTFAQCLVDKGAKFYGAFWCPHCQEQERMLDASRQKLERIGLYTECSTADTRGQTQVCIDAGVKQYPTWRFADGTEITGEQELSLLSERSGCVLPGAETAVE
jgi:thiol-disulfide isomerase/thioredoxin